MGLISDRNATLDQAIDDGRALSVFRQIYHPDVTMIESDGTECSGLDANYEREQAFFGSIAEVHEARVIDSVVDEEQELSFARMHFDCTLHDGRRMKMTEVAVREWRDGKIHRERFFFNPQQALG